MCYLNIPGKTVGAASLSRLLGTREIAGKLLLLCAKHFLLAFGRVQLRQNVQKQAKGVSLHKTSQGTQNVKAAVFPFPTIWLAKKPLPDPGGKEQTWALDKASLSRSTLWRLCKAFQCPWRGQWQVPCIGLPRKQPRYVFFPDPHLDSRSPLAQQRGNT